MFDFVATNSTLLLALLILLGLLVFVGLLFLLRALLHAHHSMGRAGDRVVLHIMVPKERRSEGQGSQGSQEDRLEQIKEEIGITETFFAAIAGLRAQRGFSHWIKGRSDVFSFEIVVHNHLIYFYIEVPRKFEQFIEQQIHAQYPYAQIDRIEDYNIFTPQSSIVGAYLVPKQKNIFPFKSYKKIESDPLSAILNGLAKIYEHNSSAAIQYIIRSSNRSWRRRGVRVVREVKKGKKFEMIASQSHFAHAWHIIWDSIRDASATKKKELGEKPKEMYTLSAMEEEMLKGIEEKLSKGGMDTTIRILSASDDATAARMNLDNLINAYSQYNLYRYGNSFSAEIPRRQSTLIRNFIYRSFNEQKKLVFNTEEMASLWHLPLHSTEAPQIKWMQGRKAAPPPNLPTSGLLLGHILYRGNDTKVHIKESDRRRHLYIIGKSGTGKSVYLANMAIQDIKEGRGIGIIDPHGDLVEDVLGHIPKHRADDVILFNPSDMDRPIGLNMLEAKDADMKDFAVQEMIEIFYKLFPPEMIGPMFEHNMRNVMLTLMGDLTDPGTIIDIPRMFTDDDYVKIYLKKLKDPVVRAFWEKEMAKTSDFHKSEMLGYLISKVGRFVENEMMRNIMGQQKSGFDFREAMDEQKILLVNLSKGRTGEVNSKLLGLIIVAKLQMAAMGRSDVPQEQRKDFYLYIDEFQNFVTNSISTILSEARKYRLDLTIAHQYMGQLIDEKGRGEIKEAVLGNVGTICVGRIGPEDTDTLVKEFTPTFGVYDLLNPPPFSFYTKLLIDGEATKPFNMVSYPYTPGNLELAHAIKQLSRLKYGRDRRIVESEILERTKLGVSSEKSRDDMIEASL